MLLRELLKHWPDLLGVLIDRPDVIDREIKRIIDRAFGRNITMESSGSRSTVVWNPSFQKAAAIGDLPDNAYRDFVCVEAANAHHDVRTISPEQSHTLAMSIRV